MKILLTGASGQLGTEMRRLLEGTPEGENALFTDADTLDITDPEAVERCVANGGFTHIVNCAGFTAVDRAEHPDYSAACYSVNYRAVQNIADAAMRHGCRVIHISTDYVFDGESCRPYRETDRVNPLSNYGDSKRKGEMVLLGRCPDAVILRTAWLYSPHGSNFVKTMLRLGRSEEKIRVVDDQVGTPTFAADLAAAIMTILKARQWVPGIYHYSNEGVASWYDFTHAIFRIAGITECKVVPVCTEDYPTAARRPAYSVLDKSAIKKTYGLEIPHWEDSLERCLNLMHGVEGTDFKNKMCI